MKPARKTAQGTAMIVSVGGTPEPVAKSLAARKPRFVVYLATKESMFMIEKIQELAKANGSWKWEKNFELQIIADPSDLIECYAKSIEAARLIEARNFVPEKTTVDFTGGTKAMSAALALATVARGYAFSYVGGSRRTKDGLGVVVTGAERIVESESPWALFAVEERATVARLFNRGHFGGAAESLEAMEARPLSRAWKRLAKSMALVCEGFGAWERFDYGRAAEMIGRGLRDAGDFAESAARDRLDDFLGAVQACLAWIEQCRDAANALGEAKRPLAADYFANARRRAAEGRCDEAVLRCYRTLELAGQIAFETEFGQSTSEALWAPIAAKAPALSQKKFDKFLVRDVYKFPLEATFDILAAIGHEAGRRWQEQRAALKNVQSARNSSPLAHGFVPIKESVGQKMLEIVAGFLGEEGDAPPPFPKLDWEG